MLRNSKMIFNGRSKKKRKEKEKISKRVRRSEREAINGDRGTKGDNKRKRIRNYMVWIVINI